MNKKRKTRYELELDLEDIPILEAFKIKCMIDGKTARQVLLEYIYKATNRILKRRFQKPR